MPKEKEQNKYYNVLLTDFQLHTTKPQNPTPWYRTIFRSFRNKKPGRFYVENAKTIINEDGTFEMTLPLSPIIQEKIKEAERSGEKIRFVVGEEGVPVFAGKDLVEKIKSNRKKHRPLTRVWRSDNIK